jgi:NAD(P)H-dependent flavin oxidoreductase YrpB (nitropropane dioxygenase family)
MGVRISRNGLASAVSRAGGLGTISSVGIGPFEEEMKSEYAALNSRTLVEEIRTAKQHSNGNPIAVNILVAQSDYESLVKACIEGGADIIVTGAGLPFALPDYVKGTNIKLIPVVSSGRAAKIICEKWFKKYSIVPDAIIVEGILAGGHLGFSLEQLKEMDKYPLEDIVKDVVAMANEFGRAHGKTIPVIAAGGIFDGQDIAKFLHLGAAGVQMATRFVCTEECDAASEFKQAYINAKKEDIAIISSPVQLPGRVIRNDFVKNVVEAKLRLRIRCPYHCLITCKPSEVPYCIAKVLTNAAAGKFEEGFVFCGHNVYRCDRITTVPALMEELVREAELAF